MQHIYQGGEGMELSLAANLRKELGEISTHELRRNGRIPAVVYGEGQPAQEITVSNHDLKRLIADHGTSKLVKLRFEQGKSETVEEVLIKDLQKDFLGGEYLHLDFMRIRRNHEITVKIGVHLVNEEKRSRDGSIIEQVLHELEISCLPDNLPDQINVDVSKLSSGLGIYVKDLKLSPGVRALNGPEETVARAVAPKIEITEAKEPEVINAKKE